MKSLVSSIVFFGSLLAANAATYVVQNFAGIDSSVVVDSSGVRLTGNGANSTVIGSAVFGYFSSDSAATTATTGTQLNNAFTQFGTNAALFNNPQTPTNLEELFSLQGTVSGSALDAFTDKNIYLIVSNASTITGGTQFLVIKLDAKYGATASEPINGTFTLDTANSGYTVLVGSKAGPSLTAGGIDSTAEASFQLAAIPEPSVALLGAIGGLALLRRRRN